MALDHKDFMTFEMFRYIKLFKYRYHKFIEKRKVMEKFLNDSSENIDLI